MQYVSLNDFARGVVYSILLDNHIQPEKFLSLLDNRNLQKIF